MADKITLEYLIEQAMKIPGVKVDRAEYLSTTFADQGILVPQIVEEGPVASDYSEIELDNLAEKLILRRTSESSAMSFAAGIPGGLAVAATIPADTLQFFAMSLRMAQELAYLYGARDFWSCEGEDGTLVRYQLICSLGAMFEIEGAMAATRLLSSHLALRAVGGTPQRATTRAFWDPIVRKIGKDLTLRLTTDTASKGVAKLIPVIGGFFSGGMRFFSMRPMGQRLSRALSTSAFLYDDSFAMKDYLVLENFCERAEAEQMNEAFSDTPVGTADSASENESWGSINPAAPAPEKPAEGGATPIAVNVAEEDTSVPVHFVGEDTAGSLGGQKPVEQTSEKPVAATTEAKPAEAKPVEAVPATEKPAEAQAPAAATAAPVSAAPAPAMTMDEVFNTIERLAALRDKGAITQEDFDAKKAELLARI